MRVRVRRRPLAVGVTTLLVDRLDGDFDDNDYSAQLFGDAGTDTLIGDSSDICYPGSGPETAPYD